jgi:hypothetical protein
LGDSQPTCIFGIEVVVDATMRWGKVFVYAGRVCALLLSNKGNTPSTVWLADTPADPTNIRTKEISPGGGLLLKSKVIRDHLFLFWRNGYMEYGASDWDADAIGGLWKRVWLPSCTGDNYGKIKFTVGDDKLYITSGMRIYSAELYASMGLNYTIRNTTITHNAPLGHGMTLDHFGVGEPVYMTGSVFKFNEGTRLYDSTTGPTDCISSVKNTGGPREFLGVCCQKVPLGMKNIGQDTFEFATHGDVYVRVEDSTAYEIGDVILMDKSILGEDIVITGLIRRMIIGKVAAKIDGKTLAVFM